MKTQCRLGLAVVVIFMTGLTVAAPAKKEREEPLPPPTAVQFETAENNLKQIALAFHNYHDTTGVLPTNEFSKDKKPLLSWRVQILPYMEELPIYQQFKLDEPWDSENNKKLIEKMPKLFAPVRGKADPGMTFYQSLGGSNGWSKPGATLPGTFLDGCSNTFLVAEAAKPVIWTQPRDLEFDGKDLPSLGGMFDGKFHAALADGSVGLFKKGLDKETLSRLIDPKDGKPIDVDAAKDEK
jgi:hypothetical protein